jgi:hypothetical protein
MTTRGVRFGRQMKLAEIGEAGQARLERAAIALGAEGFTRTIEKAYLERAGAQVAGDGARVSVDPSMLGLRHEAAKEVGEGALRALAAIREVIAKGTG